MTIVLILVPASNLIKEVSKKIIIKTSLVLAFLKLFLHQRQDISNKSNNSLITDDVIILTIIKINSIWIMNLI